MKAYYNTLHLDSLLVLAERECLVRHACKRREMEALPSESSLK